MKEELVSAVIVTHERLDFLKKALDSVRNQTYKNIEIILVDDASTDGTKEWAMDIENIKYIYIPKEEHKGGNYARNIGIKNSSGKYVAFLDDDDTWCYDKIEKQMQLIENNKEIGVVYCGYNRCYENGLIHSVIPNSKYRGDVSKYVFGHILCLTSSLLVRRELLLEVGMFDENLKYWQETELIIRLAQISNVDFVSEPLINYSEGQASNDFKKLSAKLDEWFKAIEYIEKKHAKLINDLDERQKKEHKLLVYGDAANRCLMCGQMKRRKMYKKKIYKLKPSIGNFIAYVFGIDKQYIRLYFHVSI